MKKLILFAAILFAGVSVAKAQNPTSDATLNVKLEAFQAILVNPSNNNVDLEYKTATHYAEGVTSTKSDHLTVSSVGAFTINVQSGGDLINSAAGGGTIEASTIKIKAADGTSNTLTGSTPGEVAALSTSPQTLITSTKGGVNKTFDISYTGKGSDEYINKYISGEVPTIYTATVTYTLVAN